jgi:hypothetical protein
MRDTVPEVANESDLPLSREVARRTEGSTRRMRRTARRPGDTRSLMARETTAALQHRGDINVKDNCNKSGIGVPLGRPRSRWLDNIELDLVEIGWGVVVWISLVQDWYSW